MLRGMRLRAKFSSAEPTGTGDASRSTAASRECESGGQALRRQPDNDPEMARTSVDGRCRMGPKEARSTVLTPEDEAIIVAFRRHTLLPLDDCLYGLQPTLPHLTRSSLHRCLERHGISRRPEMECDKPKKKRFADYPIGYMHIDIAEVRTEEGKLYLFVAIDRTSKLAFAKLEM